MADLKGNVSVRAVGRVAPVLALGVLKQFPAEYLKQERTLRHPLGVSVPAKYRLGAAECDEDVEGQPNAK